MGKTRDGSECYTRYNKSGGEYVTCEGTQKGSSGARRPTKKGFGKRTGGAPGQRKAIKVGKRTRKTIDLEPTDTSKKYKKATFDERVATKVAQMDLRNFPGYEKRFAKNPHTWMKTRSDGKVSTPQLKEIISKYENGTTKQGELNKVIYTASKKILESRN